MTVDKPRAANPAKAPELQNLIHYISTASQKFAMFSYARAECSSEQVEMTPGHVAHHSALPSASHTRIIELQPAVEETEDLHIEISVADLASPLESYEALSYTWGGIPSSSKVIVSQTRAISVTKNLEDALRRFRLANRPRRLWIDAICINQNDDKEKGHQIPLMSAIYRGAATVLVWLGRDAEVEASLGRLSDLGRLILSEYWDVSADVVIEIRECISSVINARWFSRRWVIQEVVLNLDVVLNAGSKELSFLKFLRIVKTLRHDENAHSKQLRSVWSLFDLWDSFNTQEEEENRPYFIRIPGKPRTDSCSMLRLMRVFSHFDCADGRDHIFTIASLARDTSVLTSGEPRKSRNKSETPTKLNIPYETSVQEAAARIGGSDDSVLPTWVPDWRVEELRRPFWTECYDITPRGYAEDRPTLSNDEDLSSPPEKLDLEFLVQYQELESIRMPPKITRTGPSVHQLEAELSCIRHWPDPPFGKPEYPGAHKWKVPMEDDKQQLGWRSLSHDKEFIFPLHVNWKSSEFEVSQSDEDVVGWMRSVFKHIWARVVDHPSQLTIDLSDEDAVEKNQTLYELLEKLDYVITAGKMFSNHLADLEERWLAIPTVDILCRILAGVHGLDPQQSLYLRLVALTVRGRCLITCDIDSANSAEIHRVILGLGPSNVEIGDRVTCINSLGLSYVDTHWVRTFLVQLVPQNPSAESERPLHTIGKGDQSPTMKFVGDCFLTTSHGRWAYDYEGLQPWTAPWISDDPMGFEGLGWWYKRTSGRAATTITLI
ncbi:hypothetical protein G7054_g8392 [Neopestalotiopsis clavispora]|nr:hypothetical protein G7054_g8392 [Neopestalotiopsis clavispora]